MMYWKKEFGTDVHYLFQETVYSIISGQSIYKLDPERVRRKKLFGIFLIAVNGDVSLPLSMEALGYTVGNVLTLDACRQWYDVRMG
ncbi:hypothetical protein GCM10020331_024390 [Ectobacillus funiculus]